VKAHDIANLANVFITRDDAAVVMGEDLFCRGIG